MLSNTKGAVLIPAFYKNSFLSTGRYASLLNLLHEEFRYDIITTNDFTDTNYDVLIVLKSPNKGDFNLMQGIKNIPKYTKIVLYLTDLHSNEEVINCGLSKEANPFYKAMKELCVRADLILCPYKTAFMYKFSEFSYKFKFFPHYVESRSPIINPEPLNRCLLSGATCTKVYPLRTVVERHVMSSRWGNIDRLQHPGYFKDPKPTDIIGKKFIDYLSMYYCAVTSSSVFNYTIAKYFEIPAAGALLLANNSGDLEDLGFVDGEHYVNVSELNVIDKISEVLYNVEKFDHIRHAGQELILSKYTKDIAYNNLKKYIKEIL